MDGLPRPDSARAPLLGAGDRPVRIGLLGEFSTGKSSLANALIGAGVARTEVIATEAPPLVIGWAAEPRAERILDGRAHPVAVADLHAIEAGEADWLRLYLPAPALEGREVVDLPGSGDPLLAAGAHAALVASLDIAIWCTPSMQAWKQSEKATWAACPDAVRARGVLAVTHGDRLSPSERTRVLERLETEAGGLFRGALCVSTREEGPGTEGLEAWLDLLSAEVRADPERPAAPVEPAPLTPVTEPHRPVEPTFSDPIPEDPDQINPRETQMKDMQTDISELRDIRGFLGACIVDSESGLMLGSVGGNGIDLEAAGAGNTEVVKAKLGVMEMLGLDDKIEDILITLGTQYHLIRPIERNPLVFIYVALDKTAANLGMARLQVKKVEQTVAL